MNFFSSSTLKSKQLLKGITLKSVHGRKTMLTFLDFRPRAVIPAHKHPHEQITYVLKGSLKFNLAGKVRVLKAGQGVVVPANQMHSAQVSGQPARVLDGWYPIRKDYLLD